MNTDPIIIKFERTNVFTRWHCHVCGGCTEKDAVLCEGNGAKEGTIRVCPECLKAGNIDARLEETAQMYERWAAETRSLIGRLVVPTYEQWEEEMMAADLDDYLMMERGKSRDDIARMTFEEREALTSEKREETMVEKRKWEAEWRKMEASSADDTIKWDDMI